MKSFDVAIAGDINLDLILYGLPPEIPVERELLADRFCMTLGGSAAITAHNLAALKCTVGMIGKTAPDTLGDDALRRLIDRGVDVSRCIKGDQASQTGVTFLLPHDRVRHIVTYPGTIAELTVGDLDKEYISRAKHFHISSFFLQKKLQKGLPEFCRALRAQGMTVSLDTNDDPEDAWGENLSAMFSEIDLLFPNEDEARRMAHNDELSEAIRWLAGRVPVVAVKCGRDGAIVQAGETRWEIPTKTVTAVDTIGAGDSFNAGFLSRFIQSDSLELCAKAGNNAAALSTLRAGGTESFRDEALIATLL
jgi:sugar/nucleoside kinase (ribokinase family)